MRTIIISKLIISQRNQNILTIVILALAKKKYVRRGAINDN